MIADKKVKLIRNIQTSEKNGNTWLFIESLPLEIAGFEPGEHVELTYVKDALILVRDDDSKYKISKRKRNGKERPLFDRCNKSLTAVLRAKTRIDILVSDGMLVIREEKSFEFIYNPDKPLLQGADLGKLRLYSAPTGGGFGTASLVDTGYFEAVGGLEMSPDEMATYLLNMPKGIAYNGDIRRINHLEYVPDQCDLTILSPPCTLYSSLGTRTMGVTEGLAGHFARVVLSTNSEMLLIEQVPPYFKSRSFEQLKFLLEDIYPYWETKIIDAYELGSVSGRVRGYAVASKQPLTDFRWPEIPKLPDHRRMTVQQVIKKAGDVETGEWRSIEGTVMEGLLHKNSDSNNFNAESNRTLVTLSDKRVSCFVRSYRKYQVTSSYLLHPEDKTKWRPFRADEIAEFLGVPNWFQMPEWLTEGPKTQLLGQSVDGNVIKSIGIELALTLMKRKLKMTIQKPFSFIQTESGQLELSI
ncbi:DNA cytosine methyltransferase [Niallia taxi]|uniref:DNA cytosine methyltransferase n=1 Tax=Niallia taxi TaxID=2499688 RepID=UPI0015F40A65|nr:DNA cytosine methyltransferase [Niallia taxi]